MRIVPLLVLTALIAGVISAGAREDQATSALINQALDKSVSLKVDNVLPEVLKKIEDSTGVRIEPTDAVYDLLPWGEQTNIKATIENQNLRSALTAIARKMGLTWELGQFEVWLKPMPALARLGRRATVHELQALDLLTSTPLTEHKDRFTVQSLVDTIDQQLASIKSPQLAVELRAGDAADPQSGFIKLDQPVNVPRNATIAKALEDLAQQTNATWYPWGRDIVIVPKQQQVRMQLDKTITAHFNGNDIGEVLDRLSSASGVPFQIEPAALQRVPRQYRSIKLDLTNATVRQVLDDIRGVTGLDYIVKPEGVYVWNQNPNPGSAPAGAGGTQDPVVAMVQTEGGMQLFLRESDVPPDVRAYLAKRSQDEIQRLRQKMKAEGFTPPPAPATGAASATQPAPAKASQ